MVFRNVLLRRRAEPFADRQRGVRGPALQKALPRLELPRLDALRLVSAPPDAVRAGADETIPLPDLLELSSGPRDLDERLASLLELAFLGKDATDELDEAVADTAVAPSSWRPESFAGDLYLEDLVQGCLARVSGGGHSRTYTPFLVRVLSQPPGDVETVRFRQEILAELAGSPLLRGRAEELHVVLRGFLALVRRCSRDVRMDSAATRLDVLRQAHHAVRLMAEGFDQAESGLRRLATAGADIRATATHSVLESLLEFEDDLASLALEVKLGSDGRVRRLVVQEVAERTGNPFYRSSWRRRFDALRLLWRGYRLDSRALADRLILAVYGAVLPTLVRLVQVMCHLEVYLTAMAFAEDVRNRGLEVCLPEVAAGAPLELERLFNPLLLRSDAVVVPADLRLRAPDSIVIVTGPNSGGKTRLLQGVGIAQVLGQSGLFVPAARARLPLASGLFASNVRMSEADETEGRLGTELLRVRSLFESAPRGALVLLDELCSGTNPSEAIEIVAMVLRLLRELEPVAIITTHFLDFAHQLEADPPVTRLEFLRVEVDDGGRSTYQFVPGVADTSMAATTARRLGVTYDELVGRLRSRLGPLCTPADDG